MVRSIAVVLAVAALFATPTHAQDWDDSQLNIFGYFQAQFISETQIATEKETTTFNLQQLNLMAQRTFSPRWSTFVNIQSVNTFNSGNGWGSINIEEAWARYRRGHKFNLTMGLLIPKFNRLNEIKNRMPVLPYVVRPFVYESSFAEFVVIDDFVPNRAFVQTHGFFKPGPIKLDYSVHLGNTRQVNSDPNFGQTGVDTTESIAGGGRFGIRFRNIQLGFSGTGELANAPAELEDTLGVPRGTLQDIEVSRAGVDLSFQVWRFDFEFEYISVDYHENVEQLNPDKEFTYGTLGYHITEGWYVYLSYWYAKQNFNTLDRGFFETQLKFPNAGFSYTLNDRIALKGQFGSGDHETEEPDVDASEADFSFSTFAVSVFF